MMPIKMNNLPTINEFLVAQQLNMSSSIFFFTSDSTKLKSNKSNLTKPFALPKPNSTKMNLTKPSKYTKPKSTKLNQI